MVVVITGYPLAYYAARYNIDLDLITRGSGFGYYGSVVTNVIFASFTFIFCARGSIMAQGLELGLEDPTLAGLSVVVGADHPARHLRMNTAKLQVDHTAVAGHDGPAVRLPAHQPPRRDR